MFDIYTVLQYIFSYQEILFLELLSTSKYVKLLTEPLKLKIKSEALLHALIGTMWKLAVYLDDKLPDLFEVVIYVYFE